MRYTGRQFAGTVCIGRIRFRQRDDSTTKMEKIETKLRELEMRIKLAEGELRGSIDLSQFGKPELLSDSDSDSK